MLKIEKLADGVELFAEATGFRVTNFDPDNSLSSLENVNMSTEGFLQRLPSLFSAGIFLKLGKDLQIGLEGLEALEREEGDPFEALIPWSQYELKITAVGTLGYEDFEFRPRFFLRNKLVSVTPVGVVIRKNEGFERMLSSQAKAIAVCKSFNELHPSERDKRKTLLALGELQSMVSALTGVSLDEYLSGERVLIPKNIGVGHREHGRHLVAFPEIEGTLNKDDLAKEFLSFAEVQGEYDIPVKDGTERQRVVFDDKFLPILKAIKRNGFSLTGEKKAQFLRDPRNLLPEDESIDADLIQVAGYGPRVHGIGYPKFIRPISNQTKQDWFGGIEYQYASGETSREDFGSAVELETFVSQVEKALVDGADSIEWAGKSIPVSKEFLDATKSAWESDARNKGSESSDSKERIRIEKKMLLIYQNEESLEFKKGSGPIEASNKWVVETPQSLKADKALKTHQQEGLTWLQRILHHKITAGGLLADEMGLGKTLQILTLAAWLIESEMKDSLGAERPPFEPILIVAPLGLLDVWKGELEEYFRDGIFSPYVILHGLEMKRFKKEGIAGREIDAGVDTLDLDKLREYRLVITNYDSVKNYQYSFGKMDWSMVVVDEAQEIKEPSTATTHAIKALKSRFNIASTGTPVETTLTNLWSIMDFVQPGNALGCLSDFRDVFGEMASDDKILGEKLRALLGFNLDSGLIRRRTKAEVLKDLPKKEFHTYHCELTNQERDLYLGIVEGVKVQATTKAGAAALEGLHQLAALSQHPFILKREMGRMDASELLGASNKLKLLIETLKGIQARGEKALVFVRTLRMQDIIKLVVDREFGMSTKIVNGSTATDHRYVENTRRGIVSKFSAQPGFNVVILSPEVAGVGLTITAANHVIHYGRWWNPAKENQATDRAYRIGQTRKVHVYHFIGTDPKKEFETFDEKLDKLLKAREALADNFLAPDNFETKASAGLAGDVFGFGGLNTKERVPGSHGDQVGVDEIDPYEFEAMVAILMRERYSKSGLTPKSGDGGVDVVCFSEGKIALVQCKQTKSKVPVNYEKAMHELIDGLDYYREAHFPSEARHSSVRLILVTSAFLDMQSVAKAKDLSIEVIDRKIVLDLLAERPISRFELQKEGRARVKDIAGLFVD